MALNLPIGHLKSWYRNANPVPISPLDDDLATAPSEPLCYFSVYNGYCKLLSTMFLCVGYM